MSIKRTFYLAGPMSYVPQFNFPMFDRVARRLRAEGYIIQSPAELDRPEVREAALASPDGVPNLRTSGGDTWGDFLARDVKLISDKVNGIIFLPGWERSRGAKLEAFVGLLQKDFKFMRWDDNVGIAVPVSRTTIICMLHNEMMETQP